MSTYSHDTDKMTKGCERTDHREEAQGLGPGHFNSTGGESNQGKLAAVASEVSRKPRVCGDRTTTQEGDDQGEKRALTVPSISDRQDREH